MTATAWRMVPVLTERSYCDMCKSWGVFGAALAQWSAQRRATTTHTPAEAISRVERRLRVLEDHLSECGL